MELMAYNQLYVKRSELHQFPYIGLFITLDLSKKKIKKILLDSSFHPCVLGIFFHVGLPFGHIMNTNSFLIACSHNLA